MRQVLRTLVIVVACVVGRGFAEAAIHASIENPLDGKVVSGLGLIRGWAVTENGLPLIVQIVVDGKVTVQAACCSQRGDIAAQFPNIPSAKQSAWGYTVNWGDLPDGPHTIVITVQAGNEVWKEQRQVEVVRVGDSRFLESIDLSNAQFSTTKTGSILIKDAIVRDKATGAERPVVIELQWLEEAQAFQIIASRPFFSSQVSFEFHGTSQEDQSVIRRAISSGEDYFLTVEGLTPPPCLVLVYDDPLELAERFVKVRKISDDVATIATPWINGRAGQGWFNENVGYIFLFTEQNWPKHTNESKYHIVNHEFTHVIQLAIAAKNGMRDAIGPSWLVEGTAEFIAAMIIDTYGILPYEDFRSQRVSFMGKYVSLKQIETYPHFFSYGNDVWASSFLGVEKLANMKEGVSPLDFWRNLKGPLWHDAFTQTFGISVEEFYASYDLL